MATYLSRVFGFACEITSSYMILSYLDLVLKDPKEKYHPPHYNIGPGAPSRTPRRVLQGQMSVGAEWNTYWISSWKLLEIPHRVGSAPPSTITSTGTMKETLKEDYVYPLSCGAVQVVCPVLTLLLQLYLELGRS